MPTTALRRNDQLAIVVFIASIVVSAFWIVSQLVNVYSVAAVGAIWELTGLPMLALMIIIPFWSIVQLVRKGFSFRSLYLYSLLIIAVGAAFLYLYLIPHNLSVSK